MLVSSDAPLPGATNKHNGQPLAEPGEGADGDQRGARRPIALSMRVSAPPVVARPGAVVRCWEGAVGRERLYRAAVTIAEDWYARRVPVRMMRDAPEFCG